MEKLGLLQLVSLSDNERVNQCISSDPHLVLPGIQHTEGSQQPSTTPLVDAVHIKDLALCVREGLQEVIINRRTGAVRIEFDAPDGDTLGHDFNFNTLDIVLAVVR